MISDLFLQELKTNNDIEQVISSYVRLKRRGRVATGLCPFHSERTPSFTVYPDSQSFYCFGCGAGGDVITFVRKIENLGYVETVQMLAQRSGMTMPEESDDGAARYRMRLFELNRALAHFYHTCLKQPSGKAALEYLHRRGLSNRTITRFGLGWAPDGWETACGFLKSKGFTEQELLDAAVAGKGQRGGIFDIFRGRVMFPILDFRGNVIGFGGRILQDGKGPKYLNSSDTPVFKKSRNLFAFQYAKAAGKKELILCEGYMDVISLHQAGFESAVATLGTAMTEEQARLISQYTQSVLLCYDSDGAGQSATRRASQLLNQVGVKVRVLTLTGAKDPDEFIKKFGAEKFALTVEKAASATEYELTKLYTLYDTETAEGKVAFLNEFVKLMVRLPNPVEREVYLAKTAAELSIQREALDTQLAYQLKRTRKQEKQKAGALTVHSEFSRDIAPMDIQRRRNIRYALAEDKLLAILIKNPDYYTRAKERITAEQFVTDRNKAIAQVLFARLDQGRSVDLTTLNSAFTVEQMSVVTGLLASISGMMFSPEDLDAYIDTIQSRQTAKTQEEVAAMADEELQAYIASLAAGKK